MYIMLKATGMVRKIDDLGRIAIPMELRRKFVIEKGDELEVLVNSGGMIVLRRYMPACIFCGDTKKVQEFQGKPVCMACVKELGERSEARKNR